MIILSVLLLVNVSPVSVSSICQLLLTHSTTQFSSGASHTVSELLTQPTPGSNLTSPPGLSMSCPMVTTQHQPPLSYGVPQGSVLGPLPCIVYTTPLSSQVSATSIDHHIYADDTQLFVFFSPLDFTVSVNQLQAVFSRVSNWMSANLLSLNPSKTEVLVIGLPQQLAKLNNPSFSIDLNTVLQPASHALNLGFLIDTNLHFDQQISSLSRSCSYHLRDLRRIRSTLDFHTANTIATSLVHSKLDYCNSLYLNLPSYHINKLQVIQNNMARATTSNANLTTSHPRATLHSLHWLKIKQRIEYKILSLTLHSNLASQTTYATYSGLSSHLAPPAPDPSSLWHVHQAPGSNSLTVHSTTWYLLSGTPYLHPYISLHHLRKPTPFAAYLLSPVNGSWHSSKPTCFTTHILRRQFQCSHLPPPPSNLAFPRTRFQVDERLNYEALKRRRVGSSPLLL